MEQSGDLKNSFVAGLLKKLSDVQRIQDITGKSTQAAQEEVQRQIQQALHGGNPNAGEGVTKSGGDD